MPCHKPLSKDFADCGSKDQLPRNREQPSLHGTLCLPARLPVNPSTRELLGVTPSRQQHALRDNPGFQQLCLLENRNSDLPIFQHMFNSQVLSSVARLEVEESAQCVDLIAGNNYGLLPLLDKVLVEGGGTPEDYMAEVKRWQGHHPRLGLCAGRPLHFTVRHFGGTEVVYSARDFLRSSNEMLTADMVNLFSPVHCTSGFVSHLYAVDTKQDSPSRSFYGLAQPSSGSQAQSVHQQVDSLLRRLLASTPSFLLCLTPSPSGKSEWNLAHVTSQVRSFRVLETALVMSEGLVHRLRLAHFWGEYHSIAAKPLVGGTESRCRAVLQVLRVSSSEAQVGSRHVIFSESVRKQLITIRAARRVVGARRVQVWWRRLVAKTNLQTAATSLGLSLVGSRICRIPMCNVFVTEYSIQRRIPLR